MGWTHFQPGARKPPELRLDGAYRRVQQIIGKGFDLSNLRNLRAFFLRYQIRDAVRHELSWTRYRLLLRVDDRDARTF